MKKLILIVALSLAPTIVLADEAAVKMVLESVHSKGFGGCDEVIRNKFLYTSIIHVETKMPFISRAGRSPVALNDEVIVIVDDAGSVKYGVEGGISSITLRKVGTECLDAGTFRVLSITSLSCPQVAHRNYNEAVLTAQTDAALWMRRSMKIMGDSAEASAIVSGAEAVYTPLSGGGCRQIDLPMDFSHLRPK